MVTSPNRRVGPLTLGVMIVGVVSTLIASLAFGSQADADAEAWLEERADVVRSALVTTVDDLANGLTSVGAFMEVSGDVSQERFADFVEKLDPRLSLIGVAYVPEVPAANLESFEASMQSSAPGYQVQELSVTGEPAPVLGRRDFYYPVQLFAAGDFLRAAMPEDDPPPLDLSRGVDAGSNPEWKSSLVQAKLEDAVVVSDFIQVEFEEVVIGKAFVVAVPVSAAGSEEHTGFVAAPMIDVILPTQLDVSIAGDVEWEIYSLADVPSLPIDKTAWSGTIDLPGASWHLVVRPSDSGAAAMAGLAGWVVPTAGMTLTLIAALVAQLMRQRARTRARLLEMQRLSDDKDRFLASVSHEIRTPLTAVAGLAHELRDRPNEFGEEEAQSLLALIAEQSDEVGAIVEDLLVAARSDIGKVSVRSTIVDVEEEARRALGVSGTTAEVVEGDPPAAWADAQRVRQILRNLISNAHKYGGDQIEIRFGFDESSVTVFVADNGPAIPDHERDRIFAPYESAHAPTNAVGSIGLGLFISRTLAELMGGSLSYRHDEEWSLFCLRLSRPARSPIGAVPVR